MPDAADSFPPGFIPPADPQMDPNAQEQDVVWSFRGYRLRASEFNTAMVHLFRAEVQRANVWRQRLDATTNWAVITTGAAVSIAFAETGNHAVILLNMLLVTMFLVIEARRYRYYELWAYRVRLMETDFFAAMLVPPFHPSADWAESLSESLLHPHFPISTLEAIGRRLRRNYLYIYAILIAAWVGKHALLPRPVSSFAEFVQRGQVGGLSGPVVMALVLGFGTVMVLIGFGTAGMRAAAGEVLPRYFTEEHTASIDDSGKKRPWYRPSHRRTQLLTLIITDKQQAVADAILKDMRRGVTAMPGTGMFTGKTHAILMCALTVTEVPQLKDIVARADDNAFVVVMPAQEILGRGFVPLHKE
jgi:uncharacterized membrane protein